MKKSLRILGYRVMGRFGHPNSDNADDIYAMAYELVEKYDAFEDNPWPLLYKTLDQKYPGSKFILTVRSPESWIKSQVNYFGYSETAMRCWIYGVGCPQGNEEIYLKRYNDHNKEVMGYFKERPDDLLVMDVTAGDGWEKLCPFLGHAIPYRAFPHANKTVSQRVKNGGN